MKSQVVLLDAGRKAFFSELTQNRTFSESQSSRFYSNHARKNSSFQNPWLYLTGAAAAAAAASFAMNSTFATECQEAENGDTPTERSAPDEKSYEILPGDPYYEVPDNDESTTCSMCLTFRQGPCRLHWKRFELCTKMEFKKKDAKKEESNNSETTNESEKGLECRAYAMPFHFCAMKHVNAYLLIGNDLTWRGNYYDSEEDAKWNLSGLNELHHYLMKQESRRFCFPKGIIDFDIKEWKVWNEWYGNPFEQPEIKEAKKTFKSPAKAYLASVEDQEPYMLLDGGLGGDPFVVEIKATTPTTQQLPPPPSSSSDTTTSTIPENVTWKIYRTYALDGEDNLLGYHQFAPPDSEKEDIGESYTLRLHIVPGMTKEIVLYTVYLPDDYESESDAVLFESKKEILNGR